METLVFVVLIAAYYALKISMGGDFGSLDDPCHRDRRRYKEGLDLLRLRNYEGAFSYFEQALVKHPQSALALASRGRCHLQLGNPYAALADCSRALAFQHQLPEAYLTYGQALYELGEYPAALVQLDKAVWYNREDPAARRWRGQTHWQLGQRAKGQADWQKALELGDEDANYLLRRAGLVSEH